MNLNQQKKDKGFWLRLAGSVLALVLLVIVLHGQDWEQIGSAIAQIEPWRLWAALLLTVLSRLAITLRWHVLLRSAIKPMRFSQSLKLTFAGLFASNFLPTTIGGDVVRLAGAIQMRMDPAIVTLSLIADRLVGMAGMAVTLPWGLVRMFAVGLPALLEPQAFSSGFLMAGFFSSKWQWLAQKVTGFLRRMRANLSLWLKHPRTLLLAFFFTGLHMVMLFTAIWLVLDGMHEPISWMRIAGIWSLVYFITLLPISVNGYGLQEVSATLLYARLGGLSLSASLTVALLVRSLQLLVTLPGVVFIPSFIPARRRKQDETAEAESGQEK